MAKPRPPRRQPARPEPARAARPAKQPPNSTSSTHKAPAPADPMTNGAAVRLLRLLWRTGPTSTGGR